MVVPDIPPELLPYAKSAIKAVAPFLLEKVKSIGKTLSTSAQHEWFNAFSKYTEQTYAKHSFFVSIALPNQQNRLKDFYVPLTLTAQSGEGEKAFRIDSYPKTLINDRKDLLVVDSAGMGKSTLLKYMFLRAVDEGQGIPIFIELRKLTKTAGLVDHICNELKDLSGDVNNELVIKSLESGDFVIFLDGYDEIPDDDRGAVTSKITEFKRRANGNKFVISSRELPELTSFADFLRLTIRPLLFDEAIELISKYGSGSARSTALIARLKEPENVGTHEFLGNPLLVSLLFKAYDYKPTIPLKKHIFYRQVYEALFETHDLSKDEGGFERKKKTGLSIYDFELVVRSLAFVSLQTSKVEYAKDELLQLAEGAKSHVPTIRFDPQNLLRDLSTTVPLFTVDGTLWRWTHKSLQEYFAALYVSAQGKEFQQRVLIAMYESPKSLNYVNFLSLFADIEPKGFRHILARRILSDLKEDFDLPTCRPLGVTEKEIEERWRLTCTRKIVYVRSSSTQTSLKKIDRRPGRDAYVLATECLGDSRDEVGGSHVDINPTLVILRTLKTQLLLEFFNRRFMDIYVSNQLPQMTARATAIDQFVLLASQTSTKDEALLQERGDATALVNQASIYKYATAMMSVGGGEMNVDPSQLGRYLLEIDTEVHADERQIINF